MHIIFFYFWGKKTPNNKNENKINKPTSVDTKVTLVRLVPCIHLAQLAEKSFYGFIIPWGESSPAVRYRINDTIQTLWEMTVYKKTAFVYFPRSVNSGSLRCLLIPSESLRVSRLLSLAVFPGWGIFPTVTCWDLHPLPGAQFSC